MTLNTLDERVRRELARFGQSLERALREFTRDLPSVASPSDDSLEVRVARGAAFLDEKLGREFWLERVDVDTLDVWSVADCVVCHVTGLSYSDGLQVLGAPGTYGSFTRAKWAGAYGFSDDLGGHRYDTLTELWVAKVRALRAEADSVRITAKDDSVGSTA